MSELAKTVWVSALDEDPIVYAAAAVFMDEQERIYDEEAFAMANRQAARDQEIYQNLRPTINSQPDNEMEGLSRPMLAAAGIALMAFGISAIFGQRKRP